MISARPHLTATELLAALDQLDIEQVELARVLDVTKKTVANWTADGGEAPGYASLFVRLLLKRPELKTLLGMRPRSGRGRPVKPRKGREATQL
jgi:DNA-binding transcriptional regulator YiaG